MANLHSKITYSSNYKGILLLTAIFIFVGIVDFIKLSNNEIEHSNSKVCGPGDITCFNKLNDHINNISGLQVSSSIFIGDGKFNTTILKGNPNGSGVAAIKTTITVDCNCQITNSGNIIIN